MLLLAELNTTEMVGAGGSAGIVLLILSWLWKEYITLARQTQVRFDKQETALEYERQENKKMVASNAALQERMTATESKIDGYHEAKRDVKGVEANLTTEIRKLAANIDDRIEKRKQG